MSDGVDSLDRLVECAILGELLDDDELNVLGVLGVCKGRQGSAQSSSPDPLRRRQRLGTHTS